MKAIYQRYMGWFDANPVNLWPHPPQELATRYVAALGGIDRVIELARTAVDEGDLRWAATLLGHAVFVDEGNTAATGLLADVLEALGFQVENATWRNFYLAGALELREGRFGTPTQSDGSLLAQYVSVSQILDALAIAIEAPKAWDLDLELDLVVEDPAERYRLTLRNGVLIHRILAGAVPAAATSVRLTKSRLAKLLGGDVSSPGIEIGGDAQVLGQLLSVASSGDPGFPIVTP